MRYDYPDASVATFRQLSEAALAERLRRAGKRVRHVGGRHWIETRRGFLEPVHHLAALSTAEVHLLRPWLGIRAVLDEPSRSRATGTLPIHLMEDIAEYAENRLARDQQRYLRRQPAHVRIVHVTDDRILRDQAYGLLIEWCARRSVALPSAAGFFEKMRTRVHQDGWLVLAAIDGDRLLGYITASIVEGVAYLEESKVAEDGLKLRVGVAMDHAALLAFKRAGVVSRVTVGLHQPEFPSLTEHKVRQGFPVVHLPTAAFVRWPVDRWLRRRHPLEYYRWTGTLDLRA